MKLIKSLAIASILATALLAGCGAIDASNSGAVLTNTAQLTAAQSEYGFEALYSAAASAYIANEASLTAAQKAQAKTLLGQLLTCDANGQNCTGAVQLARNAQAAGDATTLANQTAAIEAIAAQITALVKPAT
jgi:hypothetical protein